VNPEVGLHFPIDAGGWINWNSFPSDNAIMYSMIAACLYAISRPIGALAAAIVGLLILFPRVFLGVHHPTDILAGIAIGVLGAHLFLRPGIRSRFAGPAMTFAERHRAQFASAAFLLTYLVAEVYWPATSLLIDLKKGAVSVFAHHVRDSALTISDPLAANGDVSQRIQSVTQSETP
jgi:hypothetical protein